MQILDTVRTYLDLICLSDLMDLMYLTNPDPYGCSFHYGYKASCLSTASTLPWTDTLSRGSRLGLYTQPISAHPVVRLANLDGDTGTKLYQPTISFVPCRASQ